MSVFFDKGNEVSLDFSFNFGLSFLDRFFVFGAYLFVLFEHLSNLLRFFAEGLLSELT